MFNDIDRIVVVDLEATCDDQGTVPKHEMETIEIGAVLVDARQLTAQAEFQSFIRPVRHPLLTPFCSKLTSIQQADVAGAPAFPEVAKNFAAWLRMHAVNVFCSWGDYDRKQLELDCAYHKLEYFMPRHHINVKRLFSETRGLPKGLGMAQALREVKLPLTGTHHRGIDDARNIAKLLPYAVSAHKNEVVG